MSIYERLGEILGYVAVSLGGLLFAFAKGKRARLKILLLSFLPGVFIALAQSTKWALFSGIAFFYAGNLVSRASHGDFRLFGNLRLKKLVIACFVLLVVSIGSFMSRGVEASDMDALSSGLGYYFTSYSSGHLYAFSDWCAFEMHTPSELSYEGSPLTYGFYTFMPLFGTLGKHSTAQVDDYYVYGTQIRSNIFTMFRRLIQDFGLPGSLVFMFLASSIMHLAFWRAVRNAHRPLSVAVFIYSVVFIYYSFGRSIFTWSSLYFSFALLSLILAVNEYPRWKDDLIAST